MIDLTPLEVRKKKGDFKRVMRGYDPELVDDFLDIVADRMEELVRDNLGLNERATRAEQQVADYRDRERALTDALVTAQEMREEVRRQATREAELSVRSAEQEAAQLRTSAEQEAAQLRSSAEQYAAQQRAGAEQAANQLRSDAEREAAQLRGDAEREAAQLRAAAQQESAQLRAEAQQEVAQLRTGAQQAREQAEAASQQLRSRQQQVLSTYQAFLERELTELRAVAQALNVTTPAADATSPAAAPAPAPAAAPAVAPPLTEAVGGFAAGTMLSSAFADASTGDVDVFNEPDLDDALLDAGIIEEEEIVLMEDDPTVAELVLLDDDLPPFEPEPIAPEDEDVPQNELELYDGVAGAEPEAGVPGPIGLGDISPSTSWSSGENWKVPGIDLVPEGATPPLDDYVEDEDDEAARLLRNAAAAGYRVPEEDELLLDEAVDEEEDEDERSPRPDGGWLPSLLEDEDDERDDRFDA